MLLSLALGLTAGCDRSDPPAARETPRPAGLSETERRERGAQLVAEYLKREEAPYRHARLRLVVTSAEEPPKDYELEIWRKQTPDETLTLSHVVKPAAERDRGALSVERKDQPTVNIAYAQSTGKFIESPSSQQIFGITAQELLGGEMGKYDHRLLGQKDMAGVPTHEVESTLKPTAESPIARVVTYLRQDTMLPAEAHLFDARGQQIRTFQVKEYRPVEGRPVVWRMEITNHARNLKVAIDLVSLSFRDKLDDKIFSRENLKRLVSR
jgi:hypothetical protein